MYLTHSVVYKFATIIHFSNSQNFEEKYQAEEQSGAVSTTTQFEYGWCLVRSKYKDDIRHGISLFEGMLVFFMLYFSLIFENCIVENLDLSAVCL